jgi:mRNA turnover protein 4
LTKTTRKGRDLKSKLVESIREACDNYDSLYVFSYENMRTNNFTPVRDHFEDSKIIMGKLSVAQLALGRTPEEEYKDNLRHMAKVRNLLFHFSSTCLSIKIWVSK